jgi:transcriptional repressor NrdR
MFCFRNTLIFGFLGSAQESAGILVQAPRGRMGGGPRRAGWQSGLSFRLTFEMLFDLYRNVLQSANLGVRGPDGPSRPRTLRPTSAEERPMKCPYCGHSKDRVVDSRESRSGDSIRRRRQCISCGRRFTSYERIDEIPYMVIKKDGGRERFDRGKILNGLLKACEKRPVSVTQLERIVDQVELRVQESPERELDSSAIGKIVLSELRKLDRVAYLRFASVYLEFEDVSQFMTEINELFEQKPHPET